MRTVKRVYWKRSIMWVDYSRDLLPLEYENFINDPEKTKTWTERGILDLQNKTIISTLTYSLFVTTFPDLAGEAETARNNSLPEYKRYDWNG